MSSRDEKEFYSLLLTPPYRRGNSRIKSTLSEYRPLSTIGRFDTRLFLLLRSMEFLRRVATDMPLKTMLNCHFIGRCEGFQV
jgi:hypothetical protein